MKYWLLFLAFCVVSFLLMWSVTPLKKLKCEKDMCMVLERTVSNQKPRITHSFLKSEISTVYMETKNNNDMIVIRMKSGNDINLKFIHNKNTAFQNKEQIAARVNQFFINLIKSEQNYETEWQRDIGSVQIYMYGEPLFK